MVPDSTSITALVFLSLVLALVAILVSIFLIVRYMSIAKHLKLISEALSGKALKRFVKAIEERKSKKIRKRYLIFEILIYGNEVNPQYSMERAKVEGAIKESFRELFGSLALSRSGISLVYFNVKDMKGVLRFKAPYRTKIITALGYVKEINGVRVIVVPLGISGTLKKALSKLRK